ncbi:MAG: 3-hydroxyacyl-CoA dehydrogenase/enoyl-CoA hydratase family protein [Firmicutes bacterium]|nr:3-hydroxyacyl-CoA dehydrogenase/enoyl-CoA hydratase family protein [Bacillota bacterium]
MGRKIKKAAVLGAGVMGATIAAHLANVGVPTLLLDIVPRELTAEEQAKGLTLENPAVRNRFAVKGKEGVVKARPAALYVKDDAELITVGNFEEDLPKLSEVDWIIEVVIENLAIKKDLLAKVERFRKPGSIISTNTSGISVNAICEGLSEECRQHFLGTHFFNPPRYMKLLEIIPARDTLPEVVEFMSHYCERVLGKGIVMAKDTPNFIANRIGVHGIIATIQAMVEMGMTVEEVDAVTGPVMGRPKSASFRTLDMVGLDTFVHVAKNVFDQVIDPREKAELDTPQFVLDMVKNGWLGDKTRKGFYTKGKDKKEKLVLDYKTMEYIPASRVKLGSVETAKNAGGLKEKLNALVYAKDKASELAWKVTKKVLIYSGNRLPEIADDVVAVDNGMKWGFNWKLGPFETWDAIGVEKSAARMKEEGDDLPPVVVDLLASGKKSFYAKIDGRPHYFDFRSQDYLPMEEKPDLIVLKSLKERQKVIHSNSGASLIDIGDDVVCLEFHSPNNAIGQDIVEMIDWAVPEVEKNWRGMVIGNQGSNFCVGANLMLILMEAQDENWDDIEAIVRDFQYSLLRMKYSDRPVVAAPFGMTLGGGLEVCMSSHRVRAAAETYMGLVELGVGLIPAGGGCKEVLIRNIEGVYDNKVDLQPMVNRTFETIAMAKVSMSGPEGKKIGYLRPTDGIAVNGDYVIYDAKQTVLAMDKEGFKPLRPKKVRVVGKNGKSVLQVAAYTMRMGNFISEYDEVLAKKVAHVICGGDLPANSLVTEEYLIDLEREAFMSLVGEPKTQARMEHMLSKGKPLRN